jgi:hypothetical protein
LPRKEGQLALRHCAKPVTREIEQVIAAFTPGQNLVE